MERVKFRHNAAIAVAGLVAFFGAIPIATTRWYLLPILLVPLAVAFWVVRAGTDADDSGLTVRALFGSRRLSWHEITGFEHINRRVQATLTNGGAVALPAVNPRDLPRLVAASGQDLGQ